MRKTGRIRGERIAAWTVVLIVHVMLGWTLLRFPVPMREARSMDSALDVVLVAALPRVLAKTQEQANAPSIAPRRSRVASRSTSLQSASATSALGGAPEATTTRPLSADSVQQAIETAARQAPGSLQTDPFAHRAARLPGHVANTFRMRPPPSLAERVALVGKLFGGTDDPCRSARDSINELAQAGDSRELQYALDYEKRFCR
ncbi:hypothetical protein [Lysobacter tyrosinilyticus]